MHKNCMEKRLTDYTFLIPAKQGCEALFYIQRRENPDSTGVRKHFLIQRKHIDKPDELLYSETFSINFPKKRCSAMVYDST